ncbi:MAG: OsmC family protein [Cyclobacteriaceae bacterium]|nr:OsmC family protein [Cyclobacteriaceae bacterium]
MGLSDEPVSLGGNNKGPSPYDLLLASLASCTSITLRMYINKKEWEVSRIHVRVDISRDYEEDCKSCTSTKKKIHTFERKITIKGKLDDKKMKKLLEIANKCPVHLALASKLDIKTSIDEKK